MEVELEEDGRGDMEDGEKGARVVNIQLGAPRSSREWLSWVEMVLPV
jgi:hypothetical protein